MKKSYKLLLLLALPCTMLAQEYTYIDFGSPNSTTSTGVWNNVTSTVQNEDGITVSLVSSTGTSTGVLTVNDSFDLVNNNGTTTPNASLPFPATATQDSFFGETGPFGSNDNINPTGGFVLSGLDPTYYYSFSIFASRMGPTDNRETQYTLTGATTETAYLNASGNDSSTADVSNIQPNANGEITLVAQPGPNNNNGTGFYYLGAIEMISSSTSLNADSFQLKSVLNLYPNPVNEFFEIKLELKDASDVKIDLFDLNGRLVGNLHKGNQPSGEFVYKWERGNAIDVVSGYYLVSIQVDGSATTEKVYIK